MPVFKGKTLFPKVANAPPCCVVSAIKSGVPVCEDSLRSVSFFTGIVQRQSGDNAHAMRMLVARNETNLDDVSNDLVRVVRETMRPTHVSLWLSLCGG
jgi:hypothetical protein